MHCVNCGHRVGADFTFCANCGAKNVMAAEPTAVLDDSKVNPAAPTAVLQEPFIAPMPQGMANFQNQSTTNNSDKSRIIIFGLAGIAAVLAGALIAMNLPSGSNSNSVAQASSTPTPASSSSASPSETPIDSRTSDAIYVSTMYSLLNKYTAERNKTAKMTDRYDRGEIIPLSEVVPFFADGADARRSIRKQMAALTPPPSMVTVQADLIDIIGLAIGAMDDASAALRACDGSDCTLESNAWYHFRSQSKVITKRYNAALRDWKAAAQNLN